MHKSQQLIHAEAHKEVFAAGQLSHFLRNHLQDGFPADQGELEVHLVRYPA